MRRLGICRDLRRRSPTTPQELGAKAIEYASDWRDDVVWDEPAKIANSLALQIEATLEPESPGLLIGLVNTWSGEPPSALRSPHPP